MEVIGAIDSLHAVGDVHLEVITSSPAISKSVFMTLHEAAR